MCDHKYINVVAHMSVEPVMRAKLLMSIVLNVIGGGRRGRGGGTYIYTGGTATKFWPLKGDLMELPHSTSPFRIGAR